MLDITNNNDINKNFFSLSCICRINYILVNIFKFQLTVWVLEEMWALTYATFFQSNNILASLFSASEQVKNIQCLAKTKPNTLYRWVFENTHCYIWVTQNWFRMINCLFGSAIEKTIFKKKSTRNHRKKTIFCWRKSLATKHTNWF